MTVPGTTERLRSALFAALLSAAGLASGAPAAAPWEAPISAHQPALPPEPSTVIEPATLPPEEPGAAIPSEAPSEGAAFAAAAGLFEARCQRCHGGKDPEMGMSLERDKVYRATVNVPARSAKRDRLIVPGDPERSLLYRKLLPPEQGHYRGPQMPMTGKKLDESELAVVRAWILSFPRETWGATAEAGEAMIPGHAPTFHDRFLAHLPSTETLGAKTLEFRFAHTFRTAASDAGAGDLWGLDSGAWISLGIAYGVFDRLDVGLRRTDLTQDYELYAKTVFWRQQPGGSPLTVNGFASYVRLDGEDVEHRDRWAAQLIVGRRFAPWLSMELVPTYVARTNTIDDEDDRGTTAVGAAAELRFTSYFAMTGEWIAQLDGVKAEFQGGTIGMSVRTSKHAFHVFFTNIQGFHTDLYAPGGDLDWGEGDFRLGFSISREFDLGARNAPR